MLRLAFYLLAISCISLAASSEDVTHPPGTYPTTNTNAPNGSLIVKDVTITGPGTSSLSARSTVLLQSSFAALPAQTLIISSTNNPGSVQLSTTVNGNSISMGAVVSDTEPIVRVEFYSGELLVGLTTTSPYSLIWGPAANGTHAIRARAIDSLGGAAWSPVQYVFVNTAPTVATAANALPNPVTATTTNVSVLGADDGGEGALTYTWTATGPAAVTVVPNGTNAAKNAVITFTKSGAYTLTATIKDAQNVTVTSAKAVTVNAVVTTISVTPTTASVIANGTQQFTASAKDQFATLMSPQPTFGWTVSGGGTISTTGLFTAGATPGGPFTVTATSGTKSSTASVTVANAPPTIATSPSATPTTVTTKSTALSVLGADDGGEANLICTWAATGPSGVTFNANGTNAAKNCTATFTQPGSYTFTATIKDQQNASVSAGTPSVNVVLTLTKITVAPATATILPNLTQQYTAQGKDQFDVAMAPQPTFNWTAAGGGTINTTTGLFTAGATPGGPFTVTATAGTISGTAQVTITAPPQVRFSAATSTVDESIATHNIPVTLSNLTTQVVIVSYAVTGGTAQPQDHALVSGTLTFAANVVSQNIAVPIVNDTIDEPDQTLVITLSNPTNATLGTPVAHTLTITDNDAEPQVGFFVTGAKGLEGAAASVQAELTTASEKTITVGYGATGGTATSGGLDYTLATGSVTFTPGQTARPISFTTVDDPVDEGEETVQISLNTPVNATLHADSSTQYTIIDNDRTYSFDVATSTVSEGTGTANLTVTISTPIGSPATGTVGYRVTGGTAARNTDYILADGILTFNPMVASLTIPVTIQEDTTAEPSETIALELYAPTAGKLGAIVTRTVSITDNDVAIARTVAVTPSGAAVAVNGTQQFTAVVSEAGIALTPQPAITWTVNGGGTISTSGLFSGAAVDGGPFVVTATGGGASGTALITVGAAKVSISATDNIGLEGADNALFTISRTGIVSTALVVNYIVGGTALSDSDYISIANTVTIPAGSASVTIPINVLDDSTAETDETVTITLTTGAGYTVVAPNSATATIADNEPVTFTLTATDATASEPSTNTGLFTITRLGNKSAAVTANFVTSGTAVPAVDYMTLTGSAIVAANTATVTVLVTPLDDTIAESDETIVVTLLGDPAYSVGTTAGVTVTISDDEPPALYVSIPDAIATENSTDTGRLQINRLGNKTAAITANYTMSGEATNGSDYSSLSGTVALAANVLSAIVTVTPLDDALTEGDERVVLTLAPGAGYSVGTPIDGTVVIKDDEATISITASDAVAFEPGTDTGTFTITRTGIKTAALTVSYTIGGTAAGGVDYTALSGTATIGANLASVTLLVTPINDALVEGPESVVVILSPSGSYAITGIPSAVIDIGDDESLPGTVTVTATDAIASESPDAGVFTFTRTGATTASLNVDYTIGGTATGGSDYSLLSGTVTIPVGSASANVIVTPGNDLVVEPTETVIVTLKTSASYRSGSPVSATVSILDDEPAQVVIAATDAAGSETAPNPAVFTFTRNGSIASALTVNYSISGSATSGSDYTPLTGSIVIPANAVSATATITPLDDALAELDETVVVSLRSGVGYAVGATATASIVIADNETPVITIVPTDARATEPLTDVATFTISRYGLKTAAMSVLYSVSGDATIGSDFATLPGTIAIGANVTSATLTVTPIDDSIAEADELVTVSLTANAAYTVGSPSTATIIIGDNELPVIVVDAIDGTASEDAGNPGAIRFTRLGSRTAALNVNFTVSGTATRNLDYIVGNSPIVIPANFTSSMLLFTPIDDSTSENDEVATVSIALGTGYIAGTPASANVLIQDNDNTNMRPVIVDAAKATPAPVTGTTTRLTVLGGDADGGEAALLYKWEAISAPVGSIVTFSPNNTNAAKSSDAIFNKLGTYTFKVTVSDQQNSSASSEVTVSVVQGLTRIDVSPDTTVVNPNGTQQYSAVALDQFGALLVSQPATFNWAVNGGGTINTSGLFLAGPVPGGPHTITVSLSGKSDTASVLINAPPTVATAADATPKPQITGKTANVTVLGADPDGAEAELTYTWSATGPAAVTFAPNSSNTSKSSVATFVAAGSYVLTVTIKDAFNATVTSSCNATVVLTRTNILVAPSPVNVPLNGKQQFIATTVDQFGVPMKSAAITWTTDSGSITSTGLFTAGALPGGPVTIRATSGTITGTATVNVVNTGPIISFATCTPAPVIGKAAALNVGAADDGGEPALIYTWASVGIIPAAVTFSVNGTNGAKTTTATFTKAGGYKFDVTARDTYGIETKARLNVVVLQTLTGFTLAPTPVSVPVSTPQEFTPTGLDQFGFPMPSLPSLQWSVTGGGSINTLGVFTAGAVTGGPFTVTASGAGISASASVTVTGNAAPTIAIPASALPTPVTGTTTELAAKGADDGGETNLTYSWSATGPSQPSFSVNDNNFAQKSTATFNASGSYTVTVTIKDRGGKSVTSSVPVTVNAVLASIVVTPADLSIKTSATQQYLAQAYDQFDNLLTTQPAMTWTSLPTGAMSTSGLYTAPATAGGPYDVKATSGAITGTTTVRVVPNPPPVISQLASASPNPVTGNTVTLRVLATDDGGEPALRYNWTLNSGPGAVTFVPNNSNLAKTAVATFTASGVHEFLITVTDAAGATAQSKVSVMVLPSVGRITISPASTIVATGNTLNYTAQVFDQFNVPLSGTPVNGAMPAAPPVVWTVNCGGSIESTGILTATFTAGLKAEAAATVTARVGTVSATAIVAVTNAAPTASAITLTKSNTTCDLFVTGNDSNPGELIYIWSVAGTPPGPVKFTSNHCNAAKATVASFVKSGIYTFQVVVKDPGDLTVTKTVDVTIDPVSGPITVTPGTVKMSTGSTQQFTASSVDQFGSKITAFQWSVNGGGTIDAAMGLFTAGSTTGGPYTVTAQVGTVTGTGTITRVNTPPGLTISTPAVNTAYNPVGSNEEITVIVSGTATDDQPIKSVTAYWDNGNAPLGAGTTAVFEFTRILVVPPGIHTITVKAIDQDDAELSKSVSVRVNQKPCVKIISPSVDSVIPNPFTIKAIATDPDGTIASVYVTVNGVPSPAIRDLVDATLYSVTVPRPLATGLPIYATATDNNGGINSSELVYLENVQWYSTYVTSTESDLAPNEIFYASDMHQTGNGKIVGNVALPTEAVPAVWEHGKVTRISTPGYAACIAADGAIGMMVGDQPAIWTPSRQIVPMNPAQGTHQVFGIAPSGGGYLMLGHINEFASSRPCIWQSGNRFDIPTTDSHQLFDMNSNAFTIGRFTEQAGTPSQFEVCAVWCLSPFQSRRNLPPLSSNQNSSVTAINDQGYVAGSSYDATGVLQAVLWDIKPANPTITKLSPGAAYAVNASGTTIGRSNTGSHVIWHPGAYNAPVDLPFSWATWDTPRIDDLGQVLAINNSLYGASVLYTPIDKVPQISITQTSVTATSVTITAFVKCPVPNRAIDRVQVLDGSTRLPGVAVKNGDMYTYVWNNPPSGVRNLSIRAITNYGCIRTLGPVTVTVPANTSAPPTVVTPASAQFLTSTAAKLTVTASDDGGEPALTYTWSATGANSSNVSFGQNGTNASKTMTTTFSKCDTYNFKVDIRDAAGNTVVAGTTTTFTVVPVASTIQISPTGSLKLASADKQQFSARVGDQFGNPFTASLTWTVSGGSTITASGLLTMGTSNAMVQVATGTKTSSANVAIYIPQISSIRLTPTIGNVSPGSTLKFSAVARDEFGNDLRTQPAFTWTATGGSIAPDGLFTAGPATGIHNITVNSGTITAIVMVNIGNQPIIPEIIPDLPPTVSVSAPVVDQIFKTSNLMVSGVVCNDDGPRVVQLKILVDGVVKQTFTDAVHDNGTFAVSMDLTDGLRSISAQVVDIDNNTPAQSFTVNSSAVQIYVDTTPPSDADIVSPNDFNDHYGMFPGIWGISSDPRPNAFTSNAWFSGTAHDVTTGIAAVRLASVNGFVLPPSASENWYASLGFSAFGNLSFTAKTFTKLTPKIEAIDAAGNVLSSTTKDVFLTPLMLKSGDNGKIAIQIRDGILVGMTPLGESWIMSSTQQAVGTVDRGYSICSASLGAYSSVTSDKLFFDSTPDYRLLDLNYSTSGADFPLEFDLYSVSGQPLHSVNSAFPDARATVSVFDVRMTPDTDLVVGVDNDDDDANGIPNHLETSLTNLDSNLSKIVIKLPMVGGVPVSTGTVSVRVCAPGAAPQPFGSARLWYHLSSMAEPPPGTVLTPSMGITVPLNTIDPVLGKTLYVQGVSPSTTSRDISIVMEYDPGTGYAWKKICRDITWVKVLPTQNNLIPDGNHDGEFNDADFAYVKGIHGVVKAAGFGLLNHPALGGRVRLKVQSAGANGLISLVSNKPHVRFFDAASGAQISPGTQWTLPGSTPPPFVDVDFPMDEIVTVSLSRKRTAAEPARLASVKISRLSNCMGAPDGLSAQTEAIPGYASINLASGNLYFGASARQYVTPSLAPSVNVSFNHLDGIDNGLTRGWRTNYDMQVFDGSGDIDYNGTVAMTERLDGDVLVLIDESGRRVVFAYATAPRVFKADPRGGLLEAVVNPDSTTFVGAPVAAKYKLTRHDNHFYYFDASGRLIGIENLRGKTLTVTRDGQGNALKVADSYDRSEDLRRSSIEPPTQTPDLPLLQFSGRALGDWTFAYDNNVPARISNIRLDGAFTHGTGRVEYIISYLGSTMQPRTITLPQAQMYYFKTITSIGASAQVSEPFGGTTVYSINPIADAWTSMNWTSPNVTGVSTSRIIDFQKRQIVTEVNGRVSTSLRYDAKGNLTSRSVAGGTTTNAAFSDFGIVGANLLQSTSVSGSGTVVYDYYPNTDTARRGLLKSYKEPAHAGTETYLYDNNGFLTQTTDARGKVWRSTPSAFGQPLTVETPESTAAVPRRILTTYTPAGRVSTTTDIMNFTTSYNYDSLDRLTMVTKPGGLCITSTYDPLGRALISTDENGVQTKFTYDALGRQTRVNNSGIGDLVMSYETDPLGSKVTSTRTRYLSTSIVDGLGRAQSTTVDRRISSAEIRPCTTKYMYTAEGWLEKIIDPRGNTALYVYDNAGRVEQMISPGGVITKMKFDSAGRIETVEDGDGLKTSYGYDASNRPTRTTNHAGGFVISEYDDGNNVIAIRPSIGNPETFTYDDDGYQKTHQDVFGKIEKISIDVGAKKVLSQGNYLSPTPERLTTSFIDGRGQISTISTMLGTTSIVRRNDGTPMQVISPARGPAGVVVDSLYRTTMSYNPISYSSSTYDQSDGDLQTTTNALGLITSHLVDDATGEFDSSYDSVAGASSKSQIVKRRDPNGNILDYTDANNRLWQQDYDADNRLDWIIRPDGVFVDYQYTNGGRLESVSVAGDKTTYNVVNQVATVTDPTNKSSTTVYDEFDRPQRSSRSGEPATTYEYDPNTRLLTKINAPGGRSTTLIRDSFGRVEYIKDPMGYVTRNAYDNFDRVTRTTYPDGKFETFEYYAAGGDLQYHTDRMRRKTEFFYDKAGRCTQKRFLDGSGVVDTQYNSAGMITQQSFGAGQVSWSYDKRGRLESVTQPGGSVTFQYRNDNQISKKLTPGQTLTYAYDDVENGHGRLTGVSVKDPTGTVSHGDLSILYDYDTVKKGRVRKMIFPNNMSRAFIYDAAGRIENMTQELGTQSELYGYIYDGAGKLDTVSVQGSHSIKYVYDAANRLERETRTGSDPYVTSYTYDNNDNRKTQATGSVTKTFTYNSLNQLKTVISGAVTTTFDYNDLGQLLTKKDNNVQTHAYTYDRLNRLETLITNGVKDTYTYNGATWMRCKVDQTKVADGTVYAPSTSYIYDGHACISQNTNGNTTHYTVTGSSPMWETTNGTTLVYPQDGRGNITGLWNGTSYTAKFSYDAFGNLTTTTGASTVANTNGPRFGGEMYDARTDQVYLRNRYYDPKDGRFNTIDPIGFNGGLNLYGYCGGDPVNRSDPMGTDWEVYYKNGKLFATHPETQAGHDMAQMDAAGIKGYVRHTNPDGSAVDTRPRPAPAPVQAAAPVVQPKQVRTKIVNPGSLFQKTVEITEEEFEARWKAHDHFASTQIPQQQRIASLPIAGQMGKNGQKLFWWSVETGATIGTAGGYALLAKSRGVIVAGKELGQELLEDYVWGKVFDAGAAGVKSVMGAGTSPRVDWQPNANGAIRSEAEARAIAGKHMNIPADVDIHFVDHLPDNVTASYGNFKNADGFTQWKDIAPDGRVKITLNSAFAQSDEAIVAIMKHELHEVEALRGLFKERKMLPFNDVHSMVNPTGSLHIQAWDAADDLIEAVFRKVKK
jgi:RHS repeat-associated protein